MITKAVCISVAVLFPFSIPAQVKYYQDKDKTHLWGEISRDDFRQKEYLSWYEENYVLDNTLHKNVIKELGEVEVKIFLGTWCGDSKKWVPRFHRVWDESGLLEENVSYIGLHNKDDNYKRGPNNEELGLNIHRVPTFIFYRKGEEIGRIVERPLNDMATDISQIALGIPSKPRYQAVQIIDEMFGKEPIDSLQTNIMDVARKIYRVCSGLSELNTYGYVLIAQGKSLEAEIVFKLNKILYRYHPKVYDSLGEYYMNQEKYDLAKENYIKVLEIDIQDQNAIKQLNEIYQWEKENISTNDHR